MIRKLSIILVLLTAIGCQQSTKTSDAGNGSQDKTTNKEVNKLKGHENSSHRHGPNGGHIIEFDTSDFLGEWVQHRNRDLITIYMLDAKGKKNVPMLVDSMVVRRGDALFSLDPVSPDETGKTAQYGLEDKDLTIAINLGAQVELEMDGKSYSGEIPPNAGH